MKASPIVNSTGTSRRIANSRASSSRTSRRKSKRLIAFGWYGGKFPHLDFLAPLLPTDATHFCDVFGGSAAVLLNVGPYPVETYNDIDSDLVNFFQTLRNQKDRLIELIGLTPFSREELAVACQPAQNLSRLERARRFYIRARQTRTGLAQTSSEGRWAHCVLTSRAGMAGAASRWLGSVEGLSEIVQRLQRVQIENAPAVEVIHRYDTPGTLFYLDPPYVHASRGDTSAYGFEMQDEEHCELAECLHNIHGRAVVSGYRTPLYDRLFRDWHRVDAHAKRCSSVGTMRQESAWLNFQPEATPTMLWAGQGTSGAGMRTTATSCRRRGRAHGAVFQRHLGHNGLHPRERRGMRVVEHEGHDLRMSEPGLVRARAA